MELRRLVKVVTLKGILSRIRRTCNFVDTTTWINIRMETTVGWLALKPRIGTFRSEDGDDYEYEFSVLSTRIRFGGR